MTITNTFKSAVLAAGLLSMFTACESEESTPTTDPVEGQELFNISAKFDDNDAEVYIAPVSDLDNGALTFLNNGMKLASVRSARVLANSDNVYNFDYGGGILYQYENNADGLTYTKLKELDLTLAMGGDAYVRPAMVNEETILVHDVNRITDEETSLIDEKMYVTRVAIPEMQISTIMEPYVIPETSWDTEESAYVFRVDVPTVLGDKIYYGVGRKLEETAPEGTVLTGMHTIVLDYPGLTNPKYIRSEKANGNTNGYRGPNANAIDGFVYQVNRSASAADATVMLRLADGEYDENWEFDITAELGEGAIYTSNWYHVGDGIAYMPFAYYDAEDENNAWGVARIDINNKTAVKLNVPSSDLFSYQSGVVKDGRFYMAISPVGGEAYVYSFDIDSTSPDAIEQGLELDKGNIFIQGIY